MIIKKENLENIKRYILAGKSRFFIVKDGKKYEYKMIKYVNKSGHVYYKVSLYWNNKWYHLFIFWLEFIEITNKSNQFGYAQDCLWILLFDMYCPQNVNALSPMEFIPDKTCPVCGRPLRKMSSLKEGIGPYCKERLYGIKK